MTRMGISRGPRTDPPTTVPTSVEEPPQHGRLERIRRVLNTRAMDRAWRADTQPTGDHAYIGPFIGEFGHELMSAGACRLMAQSYMRVTVCTRPGREAIHTDYADKVVTHDIQCEGMVMTGYVGKPGAYVREGVLATYAPEDTDRIIPTQFMCCGNLRGKFIVYGQPLKQYAGATVFHARSRPHVSMRNWPLARWTELAARMQGEGLANQIVCIGTLDQAMHVPGTEDARVVPLARQMDILRSARMAVGPSSGPLHLASLCGCPHVAWCGGGAVERNETMSRYRSRWNPHGTAALAIPQASWQPHTGSVLRWVKQLLRMIAVSEAKAKT